MAVGRITEPPSPLPTPPRRDTFGHRLSVVTETDDSNTPNDGRQILRGRLNQSWQNAVAKFKAETGKDLGDFRGGKDGVLGTLRKRYAEDNDDTKKKDELYAVVDKALSCVEFIANIAAQVGSMAFSQANLCFSALETLINIPQAFKRLRDSLHALFNQMVSFLTNFQILERVDSQLGLDTALVEKTNDILIAMVTVCRLSHDIPRHKFLTVMGNIFLKDDRVQAALESVRGLVDEQNKLTSTITLEAALQTRTATQTIDRTVTKIGDDVNGISVRMNYIQAFQTDDKNLKANQEKIAEIDNAFGVTEATIRQPLHTLEQCRINMLNNTMDVLAKNDGYIDWSRSKARRRLLFLQGEKGSGRTYLLAALTRFIYYERDHLTKDDHKIYVAYYAFRREDNFTESNDSTPWRGPLGVMACQIARQSENYTKALCKNLDATKDARKLEDFWRELRLDDFEAPDDSILYLFFDGLEQLKAPLKDLKRALDPAVRTSDQPLKTRRKLRLRVIFTGNKETFDSAGQTMPKINVKQLNEPLLKAFVEREMRSMLQDGLVLKQSAELAEAVLTHATGSFTGVLQRLDMIKNAVSMDLEFEELLVHIQSNKDPDSHLKGAEIVDKVCSTLSSEHQEQLKEVLYWTGFGLSWFTIKQLDVALLLRRPRESLEPLESKVRTRFAPAVTIDGENVMINSDVEQYMRGASIAELGPTRPSRITLEVKIENVDESIVKQFFWDLNNAMATERFDFTSGLKHSEKAAKERPSFSYAEAHYTLAMRCLQILNDDEVRSKTAPLLSYACTYLPNHINWLRYQNCYGLLSLAQRRALGQGLIGLLTDTECIDSVWSSNPIQSSSWMYHQDNMMAVGQFLVHPLILEALDPRDRRMADKLTRQTPEKPVPFLEPLAMVAASRWLERAKAIEGQELDCFHVVNAYLHLLEVPFDSLRFKPQFNFQTEEESFGDKSVVDDVATGHNEVGAKELTSESNGDAQENQASALQEVANPKNEDGDPGRIESDTSEEGVDGAFTPAGRSDEDVKQDLNQTHIERNSTNTDSTPEIESAPDSDTVTALRVRKALDWSLKQLRLEADFFVFQRLGRTLINDDNDAAIAYLKQAYETAPVDNFNERLKAACALADAYAFKSTTEAYEVLVPVIEESRNLNGERRISKDEKSQLFVTLTKAAVYLIDKQNDADAISVLEDALVYSPADGQCRHDLIRLLCKTNQTTRAQELFDQWTDMSTEDKGRGPQAHFVQIARRDQHVALCTLFYSTWQSPLHSSIVQALTVAIEYDGDDTEYLDKSALHFARGLALAITREDEGLEAAVQEWEACIYKRASASVDVDADELLTKSWTYAVQYHFDSYRRELSDNPHMSVTQKTTMLRRLQDVVENRQVGDNVDVCIARTPWSYVAAFARLAGLDRDAKDILRSSMALAIRILRDDDPENDGWGLWTMLEVLRCYGDLAGVCVVWSLFDRGLLAQKREQRWAAKSGSDEAQIHNDAATPPPEPISQVNTGLSDGEGVTSTSETTQIDSDCNCDGCGKDFDALLEPAVWSCTFCPNTDFCTECYEKLKNKRLDLVLCSHNHVHTLMQHFDYDKEELQDSNVKIDWKLVEQGEEKTRQRDGGKMVKLNEWLDILAHEWAIASTT